ncbi:MAG: VCBS repeat-containing protein, partial [Candidatus Hydrogenedentes bacterium]|nr:VCBS repeat-containing protein [Candidatus Hydrogenedentota bacterium]
NVLRNVAKEKKMQRWTVNTKLRIEWTEETDGDGHYLPGELTVFDTKILERQGATVFKHRVLQAKIKEESCPVVYDLNRDGHSDILLPSNDIVMWNLGDGQFDNQKLFTAPGFDAPISVYTAIVADFDRDGYVDLLCSGQYKERASTHPSTPQAGLFLFRGDAKGNFVRPGERVASPAIALSLPVCVTAGDIDGDGDLDVWLAQYKNAYREGSMPTPFYDANDGYPSYLLVNRGNGIFDDMTEAAGLAPKRHRRTFAASFVDLDEDLDLDLLVSSDYAGTDIHINSGTGHFTDETDAMLKESANFGMGHTFGDYDQDGALDFYVLGMASTTMRRLNQMGLIREDRPEYLEMRTRMGYGNRMYLAQGLAQGKRTFRQPEFRDHVARSGWSWGTTSFDFDSDGDMDVYVANGHVSGKTTKDYCTRFWCHDIYTGDSQSSPVLAVLFKETYDSFITNNLSWDGYQKNHLFMNQSGKDFINVAFLM